MGVGLLTLVAAAGGEREDERAACGAELQRPALLQELELAALEGRLEEADLVKERVLDALACGPLVERDWLARWWLAEAVLSSLHGDEQPTDDALLAAARLAPEVWVEGYGPSFRQRQREIAAQPPPARGRLVVEPVVSGEILTGRQVLMAVDGEAVEDNPLSVEAGYHLLQLGFGSIDVRYARPIYVVPEQDLVVRAVIEGDPPSAGRQRRKPFPVLAAAGGVLGLGATITAVLAVDQNSAMYMADTPEQLTAAYRTQRALGGTSYVLMGATVACFGLELAF